MLFRKYNRARLKCTHEHLGKAQGFWNNVIWMDKAKIELVDDSSRRHSVYGKHQRKNVTKRTLFKLQNLVMLWFEVVCGIRVWRDHHNRIC